MRFLKFILCLFLLAPITYGQKANRAADNSTTYPSQIIFGVFCGECSKHCATMYKYTINGKSHDLYVDKTDSYFKNFGNVICATRIKDVNKILFVDSLVTKIPVRILDSNKGSEVFGCPDCYDGCGIYFEIIQNGIIKKYHIDNQETKMPVDIKEFSESIKKTLRDLNKD